MAKKKEEMLGIPVKQPSTNRKMKGELDVYHDLFKLEVERVGKNIAVPGSQPLLVGIDHCHYYHSVNSRGKKQADCTPIAGHTHKVTYHKDDNGDLVGECSGPYSRQLIKLANGTRAERVMPTKGDNHTHKVTYQNSSVFKMKDINPDAVKHASYYLSPDQVTEASPNGQ